MLGCWIMNIDVRNYMLRCWIIEIKLEKKRFHGVYLGHVAYTKFKTLSPFFHRKLLIKLTFIFEIVSENIFYG